VSGSTHAGGTVAGQPGPAPRAAGPRRGRQDGRDDAAAPHRGSAAPHRDAAAPHRGSGRPRLMVVTTVPVTAWVLMRGKLRFLREQGFDVVLVSSPGPDLHRTAEREGVRAAGVPMSRPVRPVADLVSLARMVRLVRAERPHVILAGTPKAGLISGLAGALCGVPVRVYMMLGLRLETATGPARAVLWAAEWVAVHAAHQVVTVSPSLLQRARALRLLGPRRGVVLGRGASNGVDVDRFAATPAVLAAAAAARQAHGIPAGAFVFGFVGRLTPDKGVRELAEAFSRVAGRHPEAWLLVAGGEDGDGLPAEIRAALDGHPRVRRTGWLADPTPIYHLMDALVLPTYREGFPNVPLEAAAAGRPVITTTATGAVDSVEGGVTGLLVRPRDAAALANAMSQLLEHPRQAAAMGERGRDRVHRHFSNEVVWGHLGRFVRALT
jgi:glycosyltransferase involved in cell wall biosynthesis